MVGARWNRWVHTTTVALVASLVLVFAPSPAHADVPDGQLPARWAPAWMQGDSSYTAAEAVDVASRFDLLAEHPWVFAPHVAAMHAANPDLQLFSYVNGMWVDAPDLHPDSWYSHDATGAKIRWIPFGTWLMNPKSTDWRNQVASNCANALATSGYDGCILDNLAFGPVSFPDDKTGVPVNPTTGVAYTKGEWMNATAALASHVRTTNPGVPIAGNGIRDGQAYWATDGNTQPLIGALDLVMMENFVRNSTLDVTAFKSEQDWKADIDALVDAEALGTPVISTTKLWVTATPEQGEQWRKYTLASFLLATGGESRMAFLGDESPQIATRDETWHDLDIGAPLAPYSKVAGVYRRSFAGGLALVNPTPLVRTVTLAGPHTDSDGNVWTGSFPLGANAGEVLIPVPGPVGVPGAATGSAVGVLATSATLEGAVNPNGDTTTYWFEYGETTAYGSTTAVENAGGGAADVAVDGPLTGLTDGAVYHYRVVASNAFGNAAGADESFTAGRDQPPRIVASDCTVTELLTGTKSAVFTVALSAPTSLQVKVSYTTADGTALAGPDYVAKSGTITFLPGDVGKTVNVTVNGDGVAEGKETFKLRLSAPVNGTIGDDLGIASVFDPTPVVSVADVTAPEGDGSATFALSTTTASVSPVSVAFATTDVTALSPADYAAASGRVTIPAGATSATVVVPLVNDALDENNETFNLTLTAPIGGTIGDGMAKATISDDDATPTLSVTDTTVVEPLSGTVNASVDVVLSAPSGRAATVNAATTDATAVKPGDYVGLSTVLTFNPGVTLKRVTMTVNSDGIAESTENFKLSLSGAVNASIADASGLVTITEPNVSMSVADVTTGESAGTMTFNVVLSTPTSQTVSVGFATSDTTTTAGSDYVARSGTLTFAPGVTSRPIPVMLLSDTLDEADEKLLLTLSSPVNASITDGSAKGTIQDDDALPTIAVDDIAVVEPLSGTKTVRFTVSLSAPSGRQVKVNYTTANGSAIAPGDFTTTSGTLSFTPGISSLIVSVTVKGDGLGELAETFKLNLSTPVSAVIGDSQGLATVTDPPVRISIADVSATEDTGTAGFVISLDTASASTISVSYTTVAGTALAGSDYTTKTGTTTFSPGQTTKTVAVTLAADLLDEAAEAFTMTLSAPSGATIADGSGKATVVDDDALPGLSVADGSVVEADSTPKLLKFVVTLSAPSGRSVKVDWATDAGPLPSATPGVDFTTATGTITFAAGATSATVSITVIGDLLPELAELVSFTLSNPQSATIVDGTAVGSILNDD